jgi:hypothetical protein
VIVTAKGLSFPVGLVVEQATAGVDKRSGCWGFEAGGGSLRGRLLRRVPVVV